MNVIDFITRLLGIAGGGIAVYLFFENRRLRIFDVDEKLELLDVEEEEVRHKVKKEKSTVDEKCAAQGIYNSGIRLQMQNELTEQENREIRKIEARRQHLLKLKNYKWLWSKVD